MPVLPADNRWSRVHQQIERGAQGSQAGKLAARLQQKHQDSGLRIV